jgi:MFS family permease
MQPLPLSIILLVLNHIASYGCRIAVVLFAIHQDASAITIGLLMASAALLPALFSVAAGRWIDRHGVERPFRYGSIAVGAGAVLPFIWPTLSALYFTSAVTGMGFMLINVAAYHAVGHLSTPTERPANFSYVALGFSTSSFIAPILAGVAIDTFDHRTAFLLLSLFAVLPILVMTLKLAHFPAALPHAAAVARGDVRELFREPGVKALFVAMTLFTVAWDVYGFAIPLHGSRIGLSASEIGVVMGAFAAATFTVRLAIPFIAARVAPWTVIRAALLMAGLSFAAIPFSENVPLLMMLMFALGLGLGAPQPMVLTLLHETAPHGRAGEALGLRTTLINGSQTVMPILFGVFSAALGLLPLFWVMAVGLLGGAVGLPRHHAEIPTQHDRKD